MRSPNLTPDELEAEIAAEKRIIRAAYWVAGLCYCVAVFLMSRHFFLAPPKRRRPAAHDRRP